jgi:hypothetical protein
MKNWSKEREEIQIKLERRYKRTRKAEKEEIE